MTKRIRSFEEFLDRFFPGESPVDRAARHAAVIIAKLPTDHDQALALQEVRAILRSGAAYLTNVDAE